MKWNDKAPAAENIRRSLPKRLRKYAAAGHATFQSKKDWDAVHDFRIQSKRMRYTLELFTEYFGPRYVELIDRVRHLQTLLGDINDLVTARRLLKGREDAVDVRERFRDTAHKKFVKAHRYWKHEFGDEALERWARYLQTQARSKSVEKTGT